MACGNHATPAPMNDLPVFLQMFVRLFAVLALGAWLQTVAGKKAEESPDAPHCPTIKQQVRAQADSPPAPELPPALSDKK